MRQIFHSTIVASLMLVLLLAGDAAPCGMSTHMDVSERARAFFLAEDYPAYNDYLAAYGGALQAGSVFPDWGYPFGYGDESEAAHWAPYQQALADYIHDTYPQPWDENATEAAVFLLGAVVHQVSDDHWHTGESKIDGFLQAMGHVDFHDSFGDAHDVGDFGGDVLVASEVDLGFEESWFVPAADAAAVYLAQGYPDATAELITTCMSLIYLASQAERYGAALLFDLWMQKSPFLTEQFLDYHYGGLDDMAIWTSWVWPEYIDLLENGLPDAAVARADGNAGVNIDRVYALLARLGVAPYEIDIEPAGRGVTLRLPGEGKDEAGPVREAQPPANVDQSVTWTSETDYGYLGTSLAAGDLNGDDYADLVVGAPGYGVAGEPQLGAVYVFFGRDDVSGHEQVDTGDADVTWLGQDVYSRFGWSVAIVDLNADGHADIAASSPTVGAPTKDYQGRVEVFYGDGAGAFSATPDVTIGGNEVESLFGYTLLGGDFDADGHADLIVGSPFVPAGGEQRGQVTAYRASAALASGAALAPSDAAWAALGENDHDWFGWALVLVEPPEGTPLLLVGAPTYNLAETQSVGRLYGFTYDGEAPAFTVTGLTEFQKLATSLAVLPLANDEFAAVVGAPTESMDNHVQVGAVHVIPLAGLSGDLSLDDVGADPVLVGDDNVGRFGWRTAVGDLNGDGLSDLWVAQPWFNKEAGRAYLWFGGDEFPAGTIVGAPVMAHWNSGQGAERAFGANALACLDFNGDGRDDLALAARRDDRFGIDGGTVTLLISPAPALSALSPDHIAAGKTGSFELTGARLGAHGLALELRQGEEVLTPIDVVLVDSEHITFTLNVPLDATTGAYDLSLTSSFGDAALAGALTVDPAADDDTTDDDTSDDDTVDDDSADDDATDDDASDDDAADDDVVDDDSADDDLTDDDSGDDDDNDSGCGC